MTLDSALSGKQLAPPRVGQWVQTQGWTWGAGREDAARTPEEPHPAQANSLKGDINSPPQLSGIQLLPEARGPTCDLMACEGQ